MSEGQLQNEVALVTGASRGIGNAIALALGAQGAVVVGTATTPEGAQGITAALGQAGVRGRGIVLNVTDGAAIEQAFADIEGKEGTPTIVVNNAGITRDNLLLRMKAEDWQAILDTNLSSVFRVSKACLRGDPHRRRDRRYWH